MILHEERLLEIHLIDERQLIEVIAKKPTLNPLFNRRPLVQPTRRMNLQEFINSTLNQGNVTIPADRNQIMQETSIVDYEDLLDTDSTSCPISLVTFDSSSNIFTYK